MNKRLGILIMFGALCLTGCPDRAKPPEDTTAAPAPVSPEEAKAQADTLLKDIDNL